MPLSLSGKATQISVSLTRHKECGMTKGHTMKCVLRTSVVLVTAGGLAVAATGTASAVERVPAEPVHTAGVELM